MSALPEVVRDRQSGNWCKNLGFKGNAEEGYKHVRFYLGKDRATAQLRASRLEQAWDIVQILWQRQRQHARPVWDSYTLLIAKAIARGDDSCILEPPENVPCAESVLDGDDPPQFSLDTTIEDLILWIQPY